MRSHLVTVFILVFLLAGCRYEVPLAPLSGLQLNHSVLGHWQQVSAPGDNDKANKRVTIARYTDDQYFLSYQTQNKDLYFRGYPIEVDGRRFVQIQFIGVSDGRLAAPLRRFDVLRYEVNAERNGEQNGDRLTVWNVNEELLPKDMDDSAMLKERFTARLDNEALFEKVGEFERAGQTYDIQNDD